MSVNWFRNLVESARIRIKRTDNAYQAIQPAERVCWSGHDVFAGLQLSNKTVLNLGSDPAIARHAEGAGAASVVAMEHQEHLARTAAQLDTERDASSILAHPTEDQTHPGQYDIVVALSLIRNGRDLVAELAATSRELLIIETDEGGWHKHDSELLHRHFPFIALVGVSTRKSTVHSGPRYLLFCGRKPLDHILTTRGRDLASSDGLLTLDMSRSTVARLERIFQMIGVRPGNFEEVLAAAAAYLQSKPPEEVFKQIASYDAVAAPLYWCRFLAGYTDYRRANGMNEQNSYYRLLTQLVERGLYDDSFSSYIHDPERGIPRLALRYKMIDDLLERDDGGASLDPVILFNVLDREYFPKRGPSFQLYIAEMGDTIFPMALDGHHRTFVAYSAGAQRLRAVPMWYENMEVVSRFSKRRPDVDFREALRTSVNAFARKVGARAGAATIADRATAVGK